MAKISSAVGEALNDQVQREANTLTGLALKAPGKWSGTIVGTWKIRNAVSNRKMLGATAYLKRKNYAISPIVHLIKDHCMGVPGTVFVVCAGGGTGKTSACHAVMGRYAEKGVAFSPGEWNGTYARMMLHRLNLDADNPPNGWLQKICDELQNPWSKKPAVLMLDDFMNINPDDESDKALLMNMKGIIRGMNIVVFALTKNVRSANKMITWNGMVSIVPAAPKACIRRYRLLFHRHEKSNTTTEFSIDWNEDNRMRWETNELKNAVLENPSHADKSQVEKDALTARIDAIVLDMNEEERDILAPQTLLDELAETENMDALDPPQGWVDF